MEYLSIKIDNVSVSFKERKVIDQQSLTVYQGERIGIIGSNGSGKSTLLKLIAGQLEPDEGHVQVEHAFNYFGQLDAVDASHKAGDIDKALVARFGVLSESVVGLSGGEQQKLRLIHTLSDYQMGLLMDEPTTHLDGQAINTLIESLAYYVGTLIVVSHDRYFLNQLVDTIWEVQAGQIHAYTGNYDQYLQQKEEEKRRHQTRYQNYQKEKKRLQQAVETKENQACHAAKASQKQKERAIRPGRLASSKQKDSVEKAMHKQAKAMGKRLEQLEPIEALPEARSLAFPLTEAVTLHHPYPIIGHKVCVRVGNRTLIPSADFQIPLGKITALTGDNGVGKTTLIQQIIDGGEGIERSPKLLVAQYQQLAYRLDQSTGLLSYLMYQTNYKETVVRSLVHQLGFSQQQLTTPVNQLSGGESTRLALARVFVQPSNVLVLDEPTNFIDLRTILALEGVIKAYPGTVLISSHDQVFVEKLADRIYHIKQGQILRKL